MTPFALQSLYECRHESQEKWTLWAVAMSKAWPEMYRGLSAAVVPTERMLDAGYQACDDFVDEHGANDDGATAANLDDGQWRDMLAVAYRAMCDAAPKSTPLPAIEVSPKLGEAMEDREDALRYRYLRNGDEDRVNVELAQLDDDGGNTEVFYSMSGIELDIEIDAHRSLLAATIAPAVEQEK